MNLPPKDRIAKAARGIKLAEHCIRKTLKLNAESGERLLPNDRRAELEAVCVILMRTKGNLWSKYEVANE